MKKAEVIKLLEKEVGLFSATEDENSLGDLYLTALEFKKSGYMLQELQVKRDEAKKWADKLRKIVEGNDRFSVWQKEDGRFKDRVFNLPEPLIVIDGQILFMNNLFNINKPNAN